MDRTPVQSSHVKAVGYDATNRLLEMEFKDGSVHTFEGVDVEAHQKLISAKSIGSHFHANIRSKFRKR